MVCRVVWFVRDVVLVPCVVGAVTVMRVLLFVWEVIILRERDGHAGVGGQSRCACGECRA